ncbi:hypothetical protein FF1_012153 [Malus domestica]
MLPSSLSPELNSLRIFDQTLSVSAMAITVHPLQLHLRSIYGSPSRGSPTRSSMLIRLSSHAEAYSGFHAATKQQEAREVQPLLPLCALHPPSAPSSAHRQAPCGDI